MKQKVREIAIEVLLFLVFLVAVVFETAGRVVDAFLEGPREAYKDWQLYRKTRKKA